MVVRVEPTVFGKSIPIDNQPHGGEFAIGSFFLGTLTRRIYIEYNIQKSKEGVSGNRNRIVTIKADTRCVLASGCSISMFHAIEKDEKRFSTDFEGVFW